MCGTFSDLLKISLSSCSDTNWPRLATKRVEQGALLTAMFGWDEGEPTGDASAGEGRKWGSDACIDVSVVGCGRDMGACKTETETTIFHHYPLLPSASIPRQFLFYFVRYLELMTTFSFVCFFSIKVFNIWARNFSIAVSIQSLPSFSRKKTFSYIS